MISPLAFQVSAQAKLPRISLDWKDLGDIHEAMRGRENVIVLDWACKRGFG